MGVAKITLSLVDTAPMVRALVAFTSALEHIGHLLPEITHGLIKRAGVDPNCFVALRAVDGRVSPEPTNCFRDLCAAFRALDGDGVAVKIETWHGWPILSVVPCMTTVAEGPEAATPPARRAVA